MMRQVWFLLAVMSMIVVVAGPQDGPCQEADSLVLSEPDSTGLQSVSDSVSVRRPTPAGISRFRGTTIRVERNDLLALSATTIGEALIADPEVHLLRYGSAGLPQALRIRTGRPGDIMYLMDGVPVTDHQLEAFDLNWLPLAATEQIEVAVNGQSSLYGSGASGGVADVASARAVPDIPVSEVVAWWGSSDSRAVSIGINRLITDSFGIVGAYENLHSGGWMDKSSANNNKFYGKLSGHAGGGLAYDIVGYRFDGDIELPDSCPNLPGTHPGTRADRRDFLTVQLAGGGDRSLHLDYHYLGTSQSFASKDTAYSNEGRLNGVSLVGTWRSADSTTTAIGTGFKRRDMLSTALGDRSSSDIFAYAAREVLTTGWRVKGILRAEKNSAFRAELAATLAASFLAHEKCRVFASLDRSFTFPSYNQLYWRGPDQPGDPRIGTEHWNGLEMGMDVGGNGFSVSATFFWKHIDNRAVWKTDESCQQYRVTDEAIDVKGLEASLGLKYPTWLEWSLSYAISHARDRSGDEVVYVPSGVLTWDLRSAKTFTQHVAAGLAFAGAWVPDVDVGNRFAPCTAEPECLKDAALKGHVTALMYGYVAIDRARVFIRIGNLLNDDVDLRWGLPSLPSRSYEFGIAWELVD